MTEKHLPYMEEFAAYLRDTEGLAERTVYRHINNAEFFLSYMSTHFFIADPLDYNTAVPREQFMKIFRQLGSRAVVIHK